MPLRRNRLLLSVILSVLLFASSVASVKADATTWTQTYGGTDNDSVRSVVETVDGGYALAGHTESFGAGDYDAWLVKTDVAGNVLWNQTYGGTNTDSVNSLVETSDGGYAIAGDTYSFGAGNEDFWLVKTDFLA